MIPWLGFERRWRDALFAAMLPRAGAGGPPGLGELDTAAFWPRLAAVAPPLLAFGLRAIVWVLALAPLWLSGRPRTFASLPPAEQDALLARAASHRLYLVRQMVLTVKMIACFAYFGDAGARAAVEAQR